MSRPIDPHKDNPRLTDFGRKLTDARLASGLQQLELARLLTQRLGRPINPGRVSEWEQGQRVPPSDVYEALIDLLGPLPPVGEESVHLSPSV